VAREDASDRLVLIDARHTPERGDYVYDVREITAVREALLRPSADSGMCVAESSR
jgi:hypothetical protein